MKNQFQALQEYLATHNHAKFSFLSENQAWYDVSVPLKLKLSFKNMLISENPGMVFMQSECGSLYIDRVKSVKYIEGKSILGTIITITCGQAKTFHGDIVYTILAS